MYPLYIDIEASGLEEESYPIEIAWNNASGVITSHLIKPLPEWSHWNQEAEKAHGISRELLESEGIAPAEMCRLLRQDLHGRRLYSDATLLEKMWLNRLFQSVEDRDCPFLILGITKIPPIHEACYERGLYDRLKNQATEEMGMAHRAAADVQIHLRVFDLVTKHLMATNSSKEVSSDFVDGGVQ